MAKPGYKVKIGLEGGLTNAEKDAAIDIIQAVLTAYDTNISFTDETIGADKIAFDWDMDYVDFQSEYGQMTMGLAFAFSRQYVLVPSVTPITI